MGHLLRRESRRSVHVVTVIQRSGKEGDIGVAAGAVITNAATGGIDEAKVAIEVVEVIERVEKVVERVVERVAIEVAVRVAIEMEVEIDAGAGTTRSADMAAQEARTEMTQDGITERKMGGGNAVDRDQGNMVDAASVLDHDIGIRCILMLFSDE